MIVSKIDRASSLPTRQNGTEFSYEIVVDEHSDQASASFATVDAMFLVLASRNI